MSWEARTYPYIVTGCTAAEVGSTGDDPPFPRWADYYGVTGTLTADWPSARSLKGSINDSVLDVNANVVGDFRSIGMSGESLVTVNDGGVQTQILFVPKLENVLIRGSIEATGTVWGVCRLTLDTIKNCHFVGDIKGASVFGVAGEVSKGTAVAQGIVEDCSFTGSITASANIGGFCERVRIGNLVRRCRVIANINGSSVLASNYIGGLQQRADRGLLEDCYFRGSITVPNANPYVGGAIGGTENWGGAVLSARRVYVAADMIMPGGIYQNGFFGREISATVTFQNCLYDFELGGLSDPFDGSGVEPKTTAEMQDIRTFLDAGWDIIGVTQGP
jgi:hypothetical protein